MEQTLRFSAGRLLCGKIRNFLEECKFRGFKIQYLESSGWIERDFIIKGDSNALITIKQALDQWIKDNNIKT